MAYAANAMGVSASAVQSDLAKMEKQARWTGRTLESYANQFKGMDAATANIWGDAYGLSPETVLLLRQGADGVAKLKAEAHDVGAIIPPETVKRASEFKAQVTQITTMIRGMATHDCTGGVAAGGTVGSYVQRLGYGEPGMDTAQHGPVH